MGRNVLDDRQLLGCLVGAWLVMLVLVGAWIVKFHL